MKMKGTEGLSAADMQLEVDKGARFVHFAWTVSLLLFTLKRSSDVYFIRAGENAVAKSLPYTIITVLLGWWGFPWGPKYTIDSLRTNIRGGREVTDEVMSVIAGYMQYEEANTGR